MNLDEIIKPYFDKKEVFDRKYIKDRCFLNLKLEKLKENKQQEIDEYIKSMVNSSPNFYAGYGSIIRKDLEQNYYEREVELQNKIDEFDKFYGVDVREFVEIKEKVRKNLISAKKQLKNKLKELNLQLDSMMNRLSNFKYIYNNKHILQNGEEYKKIFDESHILLSEKNKVEKQLIQIEKYISLTELTNNEINILMKDMTNIEKKEYNRRKQLKNNTQENINLKTFLSNPIIYGEESLFEGLETLLSNPMIYGQESLFEGLETFLSNPTLYGEKSLFEDFEILLSNPLLYGQKSPFEGLEIFLNDPILYTEKSLFEDFEIFSSNPMIYGEEWAFEGLETFLSNPIIYGEESVFEGLETLISNPTLYGEKAIFEDFEIFLSDPMIYGEKPEVKDMYISSLNYTIDVPKNILEQSNFEKVLSKDDDIDDVVIQLPSNKKISSSDIMLAIENYYKKDKGAVKKIKTTYKSLKISKKSAVLLSDLLKKYSTVKLMKDKKIASHDLKKVFDKEYINEIVNITKKKKTNENSITKLFKNKEINTVKTIEAI